MRTLPVLFVALMLCGCPTAGERARTGCPTGETCSELTPNGLFFVGPSFQDDVFVSGVKKLALGGTENIKAVTEDRTDAPGYAPFTAASSGPAINIGSTDAPYVTVGGASAGVAYLRLLEPGTNDLLDRVQVEVLPVARASFGPIDLMDDTLTDGNWAIYPVDTTEIMLRMYSAGDERLVDNSAVITASADDAGTQVAWDTISFVGAGSDVTFTAEAGGGARTATVPLVSTIDTITPITALGTITTSAGQTLCFRATSGTRIVAGAPWQFAGTNLEITPEYENCAYVKGIAEGPATLDVSAAGAVATVNITVLPPATKRSLALDPDSGPDAGERAQASLSGSY